MPKKSTKRKVKVGETRVAGTGGDGNLYGVTTMTVKGGGEGGFRKKVCGTCPWRKDAEVGRFPPQAYIESAGTAYDGAMNMFACHESGIDHQQTCAGFLQANSLNNVGVRIAIMRGDYDPRKQDKSVPLHRSYRDMAFANGCDPDEPVLLPCRIDGERMENHVARLRKFHALQQSSERKPEDGT